MSAGSARRDPLRGARRLVPGRVGVEDDLLGPGEPRAERLRRGGVADAQRDLRQVCLGPALVAQQHVVVGDHMAAVVGPAAQPGRGLGEDRPSRRGGEARRSARPRPAPCPGRTRSPRARARRRWPARPPRTPAAPTPRPTACRPAGRPSRRRRGPPARARAARAAGSSGARAPGARRRPWPTRGTRARGGRRRPSRPGSWLPTSTNHFAAEP